MPRHRRRHQPLEQLLAPRVDDREADAPDAAAHDVHAEQAGNHEVDVARARLANERIARRGRGSDAAGAALDRVVDEQARRSALGPRVVETVLDRARPAAALHHERDLAVAQRREAAVEASARAPPRAPSSARERRDDGIARRPPARRRRARSPPACSGTRCRARSRAAPGNAKVQNTASGSRRNSRTRTLVSSRSDRTWRRLTPSGPCAALRLHVQVSFTKLPSGERHEHVLERRRVGRELRQARGRVRRARTAARAPRGAARRRSARTRPHRPRAPWTPGSASSELVVSSAVRAAPRARTPPRARRRATRSAAAGCRAR